MKETCKSERTWHLAPQRYTHDCALLPWLRSFVLTSRQFARQHLIELRRLNKPVSKSLVACFRNYHRRDREQNCSRGSEEPDHIHGCSLAVRPFIDREHTQRWALLTTEVIYAICIRKGLRKGLAQNGRTRQVWAQQRFLPRDIVSHLSIVHGHQLTAFLHRCPRHGSHFYGQCQER